MRKNKFLFILLAVVFCLPLLISTAEQPAQAASDLVLTGIDTPLAVLKSPLTADGISYGWDLSNSKVVDPGTTVKIREGVLTTNFVVESVATAASSDVPIQTGVFRMTMSVFSPARNMPGQLAGRNYVRGIWTIVDESAGKNTIERRHDPDAIRGTLAADLSFNPALEPAPFAAAFRLPLSLAKGRWTTGQGTFAFDQNFEGMASMAVKKRPDVLKAVEK